MNKVVKIGIFVLSLLFLGCDQDEKIEYKEVEDGIYSGTFTIVYASGKRTGQTTLKLENGEYDCTGNSDRIPAGGAGSYTVSGDKIIFTDVNFWTADFDWGLILSGEYDYTFDGRNLKISKNNTGTYYEYNLRKQ